MDWDTWLIQCTLKVKEAIVSLYNQSLQELQAISTPFGSPYKDPKNLDPIRLDHDPSKVDP